jgi:hypothetical protein
VTPFPLPQTSQETDGLAGASVQMLAASSATARRPVSSGRSGAPPGHRTRGAASARVAGATRLSSRCVACHGWETASIGGDAMRRHLVELRDAYVDAEAARNR